MTTANGASLEMLSPSAEALIEAVRRLTATLNDYNDGTPESTFTAARLYDRVSGNFKAVGWRVDLTYFDEDQQFNEISVLLSDADIPRIVQSALGEFEFLG